ncbi:MAG: class I SAM-dependent methyltransferase, partial [Pseudolabrys sp.]
YEGHMAMPDVGQAKMLANEFEELLKTYTPTSAALIGCAGGNGFEEAAKAGVTRLIGVDINPAYIAEAKARYAGQMMGLELCCADIEGDISELRPVQVVYGALVFEYVDIAKALKNLRGICLSNGVFAALLQLPKEGAASVSPSPFATLKGLSSIMRLVPPDDFRKAAERLGFCFLSQKLITVQSEKQFSLQVFRLSEPTLE